MIDRTGERRDAFVPCSSRGDISDDEAESDLLTSNHGSGIRHLPGIRERHMHHIRAIRPSLVKSATTARLTTPFWTKLLCTKLMTQGPRGGHRDSSGATLRKCWHPHFFASPTANHRYELWFQIAPNSKSSFSLHARTIGSIG